MKPFTLAILEKMYASKKPLTPHEISILLLAEGYKISKKQIQDTLENWVSEGKILKQRGLYGIYYKLSKPTEEKSIFPVFENLFA